MSASEKLPWFSPDESVEALELFEEVAFILAQISEYAPLRKDLRLSLSDKARTCREFVQRTRRPSVERSVMLALDVIAEKRKIKNAALLQEAVEGFVSKINRGEK